jgi:hypothetical protein
MPRLVHIQDIYNFDLHLNYVPYRYRFQYYSQKKFNIAQIEHTSLVQERIAIKGRKGEEKYRKTYSPPVFRADS